MKLQADPHTERQATQHGFLPSLLCDGDKEIEIVYGEEIIFCTAAKAEQKYLYWHHKPNEPT
jgi:hypothetical protein